jgi:DNA-binding SARP family transcriptional activator
VKAEPLRESAHRCLIGVFLAEGNQAEALRAYRVYRELLREQLKLEPSALMEKLVDILPADNAGVTAPSR